MLECRLLLLGIASVLISSYSLINRGNEEVAGYRNAIMAEKRAMLTNLVAAVYNIAEQNFKESQGPSDVVLKGKTLRDINSFRYGKDGTDYFYTMDTGSRSMLQHPKESLVGKPDTVAQSSQVSGEIARDISDVTRSSNDISNSCTEVNMSSQELAQLAEQLNQMVNKFKV